MVARLVDHSCLLPVCLLPVGGAPARKCPRIHRRSSRATSILHRAVRARRPLRRLFRALDSKEEPADDVHVQWFSSVADEARNAGTVPQVAWRSLVVQRVLHQVPLRLRLWSDEGGPPYLTTNPVHGVRHSVHVHGLSSYARTTPAVALTSPSSSLLVCSRLTTQERKEKERK